MKKVFPQDQTNQTLDRFRQGDSEAFASLYQSHWQQVFRFSRLYLRSDDDAEDVVQEVFIRLWQIHESIHPGDNFSGLLFIITRNLIFNRFRRQIDPLGFKVSVLAALETSDDIESEISARDLSEYIDRLVDLMPARQRQVFNMSRREHKSYREIAEELDLSQKTVEAHMREALRFLRDNLAVLLWLALFHDGMTS